MKGGYNTKEAFERILNKQLLNPDICKENREFYKEFFEKQEYKLKRRNGLRELDEPCYKTMHSYVKFFGNINKWFNNKPLKDITKVDFKKFYDEFEDGKILGSRGNPIKDRRSYYNKVFRSKPFQMLGKGEIVREVMEFHNNKEPEEVRFIYEEDVRKIINIMIKPSHKALTWLSFDIGENINALLQLRKRDFIKQTDRNTNIPEYRVNLRKEILKRSRLARSELTNFKETVDFLDIILKDLNDDEIVFPFEYRNSKKILDRAVELTSAKCKPNGQNVTWKDLRSSMACDLLKKDWSTDEINRRLGHKPSSKEIDKYVNFLAIDGKKPQRKVYQHNLAKIQGELEKSQEQSRLHSMRFGEMKSRLDELEKNSEQKSKVVAKSIEKGSLLSKETVKELLKEMIKSGEIQL